MLVDFVLVTGPTVGSAFTKNLLRALAFGIGVTKSFMHFAYTNPSVFLEHLFILKPCGTVNDLHRTEVKEYNRNKQ